jgi:hypothetical protein
MVRNGYSLKQAAFEIGHPLDLDEAERVQRRREFQEILRVERNKYYSEVANDPTRTKSAVLGRMHILADRLHSDGEFDKAAVVLEKLAKMEGWSGNEGNINIFSGLTHRDIAEARERLESQSGRTVVAGESVKTPSPDPVGGLPN